MRSDIRGAIVHELEELIAGRGHYRWVGLCSNMSRAIRILEGGGILSWEGQLALNEVKELFELWPEYSGEISFPVPCPNNQCPERAYWRYRGSHYEGKYGASRLRLAKFLVDKLKEGESDE